MDFTDFGYYYWFLPLVMFGYFVLFRRERNHKIMLLITMSYLFFWMASGWHFILLLISTCTDWIAGGKISRSENQRTRKRWLQFSIILNLGLLATFKYLDFMIDSLNFLSLRLPNSPQIDTIGLLLPVGISFYTFQTMSYTIDIYRKKSEPYQRFIDFACYASFFPQLVAGPIVRSDEFIEQIENPQEFSISRMKLGITLIVYGLVKKFIIANNVALHVNFIFAEGSDLDNIALIWWGALAFGVQIYCDFSAYTDIAIGSAIIFGIQLPENFKTPYAATSPRDFWRRWHISLSTWLRDYLYIPLGGNRNGLKRLIFAVMVTMILGGLWHGASWNFVIWGLLHGLLLLINHFLSSNRHIGSLFLRFPKPMKFLGWFTTQYMIFFTWLIFRIEDTQMLVRSMKTFVGIDSHFNYNEMFESLPEIRLLTIILLFTFIIFHLLSGLVGGGKYWLARRGPITWGIICGISIALCVLLRPSETIDFIYFRF
jgi:alginate O-acetyltransferase complex protein AlgI